MVMKIIGGFLMALADSVPGVSGGTIAFVLGFYDKFIGSLNTLTSKKTSKDEKKEAVKFLIKLGCGWVLGFLMAVIFITSLFEEYIYEVSSLFVGFIILSIPIIIKEEKNEIKNKYNDEIKYSRDDYTLQKESNGEWIILEPAREFLVRKECVTLKRKESDTQTVNLALGYDLEPGNYRFVKSFAEQGEIALPFEVTKENTKVTPVIVSQSAVSVVLGGYDNGALTYMITNQTGKKIRYSYEAIGKEKAHGGAEPL